MVLSFPICAATTEFRRRNHVNISLPAEQRFNPLAVNFPDCQQPLKAEKFASLRQAEKVDRRMNSLTNGESKGIAWGR
jgi:hypothetical protein